jgi:hypothetical protein
MTTGVYPYYNIERRKNQAESKDFKNSSGDFRQILRMEQSPKLPFTEEIYDDADTKGKRITAGHEGTGGALHSKVQEICK